MHLNRLEIFENRFWLGPEWGGTALLIGSHVASLSLVLGIPGDFSALTTDKFLTLVSRIPLLARHQ